MKMSKDNVIVTLRHIAVDTILVCYTYDFSCTIQYECSMSEGLELTAMLWDEGYCI